MFIKKFSSASPQSRKWETPERWCSFCSAITRHGMYFTNIYCIPCPNILVKITWHEPKEIPSHLATSLIILICSHQIMWLCYQFNTSAQPSVSECSSLSMEVCPFLKRQNQSKTCTQLMASLWRAVWDILYFWFPFSWVLCRSFHTGIVVCSWAWQIQYMTQTLYLRWKAAVRSCWLRTCRKESRHTLSQCNVRYYNNELSPDTFWSRLIFTVKKSTVWWGIRQVYTLH